VYLRVRRWKCKGDHYYRQERCQEMWQMEPRVGFHVVHDPGGQHDCCPWNACPHGNPPHARRGRGTTLWVREEWAGVRQPPTLLGELEQARLWDALEDAAERALQALGESVRQRIQEAIDGESSLSPEARENPAVVVDWLLDGGRRVLTGAERARLLRELRQALREHGFDLDEVGQ
jgi:hypothetical protein